MLGVMHILSDVVTDSIETKKAEFFEQLIKSTDVTTDINICILKQYTIIGPNAYIDILNSFINNDV